MKHYLFGNLNGDKTIKIFVLQTVPNSSLQTIQLTVSSQFDVSAPTSRISSFYLFIYIVLLQ